LLCLAFLDHARLRPRYRFDFPRESHLTAPRQPDPWVPSAYTLALSFIHPPPSSEDIRNLHPISLDSCTTLLPQHLHHPPTSSTSVRDSRPTTETHQAPQRPLNPHTHTSSTRHDNASHKSHVRLIQLLELVEQLLRLLHIPQPLQQHVLAHGYRPALVVFAAGARRSVRLSLVAAAVISR
jgi:hypothetical protein